MIFNSENYKELKEKYSGESIYRTPPIIQRFDLPQYVGEKDFLERMIAKLPPEKRNRVISSLLSEDWGDHLGMWFEVHLYDWLSKNCIFKPFPTDDFKKPDFRLENDPDIFIEAKAILIKQSDREIEHLECELIRQLREINISAEISINEVRLKSFEIIPTVVDEVRKLLTYRSPSIETLNFYDGSVVVLEILEFNDGIGNVGVSGFPKAYSVNAEKLRKPIIKKYETYRNYRTSANPYLVAVFLEDIIYGPEDVRYAIFGNDEYLIDVDNNKIVGKRLDMKGIHFSRKRFQYRSIDGVLVFKGSYLPEEKRRTLRGFFIENPYAYNQDHFSPDIFNVEMMFQVVKRTTSGAEMKWINKNE